MPASHRRTLAPTRAPTSARNGHAARSLIGILLCGLLAGLTAPPTPALAQRARIAPEADTGRQDKALATASRFMISVANPLAADAGRTILRQGGSAADAAIAAQLVLGIVEPQSSGLGGGGFALHWQAANRTLTSYDGRESAPAAATADRFPPDRSFDAQIHSGLSIGVPGLPRLLAHLHERHGRLPWQSLFAPAIRLAEQGFPVSPRLNGLLTAKGADRFDESARRHYFTPEGKPWPIGHILTNPEIAATLSSLASAGVDPFYRGPIASAVLAAAHAAPRTPSDMTANDLATYAVKERKPVCIGYRAHTVCGMGPPSSGALTIAQTLLLLTPFDLGSTPDSARDPAIVHLITEAQKLAYADRNRYIADPDFVAMPEGYLDPGYLSKRRALIDRDRAQAKVRAGTPPGVDGGSRGWDTTLEKGGTTHISVVDAQGNAVSMTSSIESAFGARVWAAGFLLNNELTDFAMRPRDAAGRLAANAVAGGKRPRSSMAPTIVLGPDGRLFAVLGSPGGSRIITYVAKALIALIDWRMDAQQAASLFNFGSRGGPFEIEPSGPDDLADALANRYGHRLWRDTMTSGLHILVMRDGRIEGGADPRREGVALGD